MYRLQSSIRYWQRECLKQRDGNKCSLCSALGERENLEVDHIDGNRSNNSPENLRLLCHPCNVAEWRRTRNRVLERSGNALREGEKSSQDATVAVRTAVDFQQGSPEMQANEWYEPHFRNWLIAHLRVHGWISKKEAIAAGAEEVGCSTQAARRYLEKMTSFKGPCHERKNPSTKQKEILPRQDHPLFAETSEAVSTNKEVV